MGLYDSQRVRNTEVGPLVAVGVEVVATGKVVRFDEVRGYGFIAPDGGGEDVFMHANDLLDDKYLFRSGLTVSFQVEDGGRGLKASDVRILPQAKSAGAPVAASSTGVGRSLPRSEGDDVLCDVLSADEFRQELTEALLDSAPTLTAAQIVQVRRRLLDLAAAHSWVES